MRILKISQDKSKTENNNNKIYQDISITPYLELNYSQLIDHLKNKGLYAQAQYLQKALEIYKSAETHMYRVFDEEGKDLLNFAHPDGSVEILPTQNQNGKIYTDLETQQENLRVTYKQPTGKIASNIKTSILTTARVLNLDLEKIAQNTDVDIELLDEETKNTVIAANEKINNVLSGNQQTLQAASDSTGIIGENLHESLKFTEKKILGSVGLLFYLKTLKENNNPQEFQKFRVAFNNLTQGGPLSVENVSKVIYGLKTPEAMFDFFNTIDPKIANQYFAGSVILNVDKDDQEDWAEINQKATKNIIYNNNPNSVWEMNFSIWSGKGLLTDPKPKLNPSRVATAAQNLVNWMEKWKSWFISEEKINNANQAIVQALSPLKGSIENLIKSTEPKQFLLTYKVLKTSGLAVGRLQTLNGMTDEILKSLKNYGEIYLAIGAAQIPENVSSYLNASKTNLGGLIKDLSQVQLNPVLDNPIPGDLANGIISTFRNIATLWRAYQNSGEMNEEDSSVVENNFNQAIGVYNTVNKKNVPFAFILKQIGAWFPKVKTPEQLLQVGERGLEYVKSVIPAQFQTQANFNSDLIKNADFGQLGKKPMKSSFPNKPTSTQSKTYSDNQVGLKKFDANDPAQTAVAQMQLALNIFGRMISVEENVAKFPKLNNYDASDGLKIIGTGPKSNPHLNMFDGVWGPNTDAALQLAQKYLNGLGLSLKTGVKWTQSNRSHASDTEAEAKHNTAVLQRANAYLSKGQSGFNQEEADTDAVFDRIPKNINWNLEVGPAQASFEKGEIDVTKNNLSSLQAFYQFLTSAGLKAPQTTGATETNIGKEGWLHEDWINALQWFVRRATLKFNAVKNEGQEAANNARQYWNEAKKLWETYRNMIATYLKSGLLKSNEVIDPNLIAEFSRKSYGNKPGTSGVNQSDKEQSVVEESAAYMPEDVKSNSGNVSGREGSRFARPGEAPITLPFANTINLRDEELWSDFDGSELSAPILRLSDFQKIPGPRMAQLLFATVTDPTKAQRVALENLGYNPVRFDQNSGEWLVKANADGSVTVPASRLINSQKIQNAVQQYMNAAPTQKYQKFLGDLSAKIGQVLQDWSQDAPEDMIVHVQDYYKYWQQAITKQMRDLARMRRR